MNLSLYSVDAFVILDTSGEPVLAKYYHNKSRPLVDTSYTGPAAKAFATPKDQRAFEKGLLAKTKKPGGAYG
jgi:coatomer subunit zeta